MTGSTGASGLNHEFNYVRNSVKVVIDAYHGDVTFYRIDPDDPSAAAYAKAFPKLFSEPEEISADAAGALPLSRGSLPGADQHVGPLPHRRPDGVLLPVGPVETSPRTPGTARPAPAAPTGGTAARGAARGAHGPLLPADASARCAQSRVPHAPAFRAPSSDDDSRRELSAFMVAKGDPDDYGQLEVFVMPRDRQVDGPAIVNACFDQKPEVYASSPCSAGPAPRCCSAIWWSSRSAVADLSPAVYVQATGPTPSPSSRR